MPTFRDNVDFSDIWTTPSPKGFEVGRYYSKDWNTGLEYSIYTIKTIMYTPHLVATVSAKTQCDQVCKKGSYSFYDCTYLATNT